MYFNKKCTLYLSSNNYVKLELDCFVTHRKIANQSKQGLSYSESAFFMIKPTVLEFNEGKDYAIEGTSTLSLDSSTEEAFSTSMKALKASYNVYTIMNADVKDYGSGEMRHTEISCK